METAVNNLWQKSKLIIKGLIIGFLALLLLIPAYFVQNLIQEREARQKEAFTEVSSKWADRQTITGPVLVIPYTRQSTDNNGRPIIIKSLAYFLPDQLTIKSSVIPIKKYRGIYQVMLYSSIINLEGNFSPLPLEKLKLLASDITWSEAYVCLGINDAKGLKKLILMVQSSYYLRQSEGKRQCKCNQAGPIQVLQATSYPILPPFPNPDLQQDGRAFLIPEHFRSHGKTIVTI